MDLETVIIPKYSVITIGFGLGLIHLFIFVILEWKLWTCVYLLQLLVHRYVAAKIWHL